MAVVSQLGLENFRVFDNLPLFDLHEQQLVIGVNGSGKTTLLWSIIVLLRSFNGLTANSKHRDNLPIHVRPKELAFLLNHPELADSTPGDIFHCRSDGPAASDPVVTGTIAGCSITCQIKANGVIYLHPTSHIDKEQKIRFAFVGSSVPFSESIVEVVQEVLSSSVGNIRGLFRDLVQSDQDLIAQKLGNIFPHHAPVQLEIRDRDVYVKMKSRSNEIMFEGGAFRKAFAALTYLMFLGAQQDHPKRVLLMEEPEAEFYPAALVPFMTVLLELATVKNVQIITTTNAPHLYELFSATNTLLLREQDQRAIPLDAQPDLERIAALAALGLLDAPDRPVVIHEGKDDFCFIRAAASEMKLDVAGVIFHSSGGQAARKNQNALLGALRTLLPSQEIRILRDPDFQIEIQPSAEEVYWDLPCIESYLLIAFYRLHPDQLPLHFTKENQKILCRVYIRSFQTQNEQGKSDAANRSLDMMERWSKAMQAVQKQSTSVDELHHIARVTHGHTWVKHIVRSTTQQAIHDVPELGTKIRAIIKP